MKFQKENIEFALMSITAFVIIYVVYKISYSDYYLEDGSDLNRTRLIALGIGILGIIWIFVFDGYKKFDRKNYIHLFLVGILFVAIIYLDMIKWYARMDRRQARVVSPSGSL